MKTCPKCQFENVDEANFCAKCGAVLSVTNENVDNSLPLPANKSESDYEQSIMKEETKSSTTVAPVANNKQESNTQLSLIMGIISTVLGGICLLLLALIGNVYASIPGLITGIIGLVQSTKLRKNGNPDTAGFVLSIIGVILNAILFTIFLITLIFSLIILISALLSGETIQFEFSTFGV